MSNTAKTKAEALLELGLGEKKAAFITKVLQYIRYEEMNTIEAVIEVCKELELEPEEAAPLIRGPLLEKLRLDAINMNILRNIRKPVHNTFIDECM